MTSAETHCHFDEACLPSCPFPYAAASAATSVGVSIGALWRPFTAVSISSIFAELGRQLPVDDAADPARTFSQSLLRLRVWTSVGVGQDLRDDP